MIVARFALVLALAPHAQVADTGHRAPLPGMPPGRDSANIYAAIGAGMLDSVARRALPLVYVPLGGEASVAVIDPHTYRVLRKFETGALPQHVVPAYDLRTLWVANDLGNTLTPIDPESGRAGKAVRVADPYNLYFTPDGRYAVVVAERLERLDFRDPHTMALHDTVHVDCAGVDHLEFTAEGRYALATCEFAGKLVKLDVETHHVVGYLMLDSAGPGAHGAPQDIRSAPDGSVFFVADMHADGVYGVDPYTFRVLGFIRTGMGTYGIYPTRDGHYFYVTNRGAHTLKAARRGRGSVSVLDPVTRNVVATWPVPRGGSPDMGNLSAGGTELWVSGRFDQELDVSDPRSAPPPHRTPL